MSKEDVEILEGEVIPPKKKTKYEPWMCEKIVEIAEEGGHVSNMCMAIGIRSRDTFYRWLNEYPEFKEAYEQSKLASQAFYENVLLAGALGKIEKYNFNSIAMILNNKFGDEYRRNATGSHSEINIGTLNQLNNLDSKQLDNKIEQLQEKLGLTQSTTEEIEEEDTDV